MVLPRPHRAAITGLTRSGRTKLRLSVDRALNVSRLMSRGRQLRTAYCTNVTLKKAKFQTYDGQIYAEDGDAVDSGQKGAFLLRVDFFSLSILSDILLPACMDHSSSLHLTLMTLASYLVDDTFSFF